MQSLGVRITVLMTASMWVAVVAQTKITTAEEYAKVMKSTAQAFSGVPNTVSARGFAEAKAQVAVTRDSLAAVEAFWTGKKKDDAVRIVKRALTDLDKLNDVLSADTVSRADALSLVKEVQGACAECHALYREGDNQSGFRFKAGVL